MQKMAPEPLYLATNKEEFAKLEERAKKLFDCYVIESVGRLCVKTTGLSDEGVMVFPEFGNITKMSPTGAHACLGLLIQQTPEYVMFELGQTQYMLRYKNPNEAMAKK